MCLIFISDIVHSCHYIVFLLLVKCTLCITLSICHTTHREITLCSVLILWLSLVHYFNNSYELFSNTTNSLYYLRARFSPNYNRHTLCTRTPNIYPTYNVPILLSARSHNPAQVSILSEIMIELRKMEMIIDSTLELETVVCLSSLRRQSENGLVV